MLRRSFLRSSSAALAGTLIGGAVPSTSAEDPSAESSGKVKKTYRVGVIGATGRGDYGHALDVMWRSVPGAELVAVADANPKGREAAGKRLQLSNLYDDYRQMLDREKLDVVTVAPRWVDERETMVTACAAAGCHILSEKPFAVDAASADRILEACRTAKVKVAVVHQQRAAPGIREIQARLANGRLGKLLAMRARGKEDARAGGEDLVVLGCHMFDLMHLLAGSPRWASAEVLQGSRPITRDDTRQGTEPIGPIAGDGISATFGFDEGVHGYFESKAAARNPRPGERFSLEITCANGVVVVCPNTSQQFLLPEPAISPGKHQSWEQLGPPDWQAMKPVDRFAQCKVHLASDLLRAIEEDREPLTSGMAAAVTIEMVQAVFAAHLSGGRVPMPLADRQHPLRSKTHV